MKRKQRVGLQWRVTSTRHVRIRAIYLGSSQATPLKGGKRGLVLALPVTLGRRNLAEWWWSECPNVCHAMVKGSVPCNEYCLPVRNRRHLEALSRSLVEIDGKGNTRITARHEHLVHWSGVLTMNTVCHLRIGEKNDKPWMNFSIELIRAVTPEHRPSRLVASTSEQGHKKIRKEIFPPDEIGDSPAKRQLFSETTTEKAESDVAAYGLDRLSGGDQHDDTLPVAPTLEAQHLGTHLAQPTIGESAMESEWYVAIEENAHAKTGAQLVPSETINNQRMQSTSGQTPFASTAKCIKFPPLSANEACSFYRNIEDAPFIGHSNPLPASSYPAGTASLETSHSNLLLGLPASSYAAGTTSPKRSSDGSTNYKSTRNLSPTAQKLFMNTSDSIKLPLSSADDAWSIRRKDSPDSGHSIVPDRRLPTAACGTNPTSTRNLLPAGTGSGPFAVGYCSYSRIPFKSETDSDNKRMSPHRMQAEESQRSALWAMPVDNPFSSSSSSSQPSLSLEELTTKIDSVHRPALDSSIPRRRSCGRHCWTLTLQEWKDLQDQVDDVSHSRFSRAVIDLIVAKNEKDRVVMETSNDDGAIWLPSLIDKDTVLHR